MENHQTQSKSADVEQPSPEGLSSSALLADLRAWLSDYLRERDLGDQDSYSVGVCSRCDRRSLWGGGMTGQKVTTCKSCGVQQIHNFYSLPSANTKIEDA
jgi:hypothetical protein